MFDVGQLCTGLKQADDGIWYAGQDEHGLSYPEDGHEHFLEMEELSFWFRHRNACIAEAVSAFPPHDAGPIFDIGGGNGFVSLGLAKAGFEVVLVEPGRAGAANAKKRGIVNVICATTQAAQFREKSLPAIGLFDVLEHIEDDRAFLTSLHALLKDDGLFYLAVPAYNFLFSHKDKALGHFRRYTLSSAVSALKSAGFDILYATCFFRFLPLPIFLFRTLPYRLGLAGHVSSPQNTKAEHAVSSTTTTKMLNFFQAAEILNIKNKKAMHFGGSCLIVAQKSQA